MGARACMHACMHVRDRASERGCSVSAHTRTHTSILGWRDGVDATQICTGGKARKTLLREKLQTCQVAAIATRGLLYILTNQDLRAAVVRCGCCKHKHFPLPGIVPIPSPPTPHVKRLPTPRGHS